MAMPDFPPSKRGGFPFHRRSRPHLAVVPDPSGEPVDLHNDSVVNVSRPSLRLVVNNTAGSELSDQGVSPRRSYKRRRAGVFTALGTTAAAVSIAACGGGGSAVRPDNRPITDVGHARAAITQQFKGIAKDIISLTQKAKAHPQDGMNGAVYPNRQRGYVPTSTFVFRRSDRGGHFCIAQVRMVVDSHGKPDFDWKGDGNTAIGNVAIRTGKEGQHPFTRIGIVNWTTNPPDPYLYEVGTSTNQTDALRNKETPDRTFYVTKPVPKSGDNRIKPSDISSVYSDMNTAYQLNCNPVNSGLTP